MALRMAIVGGLLLMIVGVLLSVLDIEGMGLLVAVGWMFFSLGVIVLLALGVRALLLSRGGASRGRRLT